MHLFLFIGPLDSLELNQLHEINTLKMFYLELCRTMLRQGRGTSFTVHPAAGVLQPFSEEMIELTSFCDMWGEYTDQLICRVNFLLTLIIKALFNL